MEDLRERQGKDKEPKKSSSSSKTELRTFGHSERKSTQAQRPSAAHTVTRVGECVCVRERQCGEPLI